MRPLTERSLTIAYTAALAIVAAMSLASHLTLNKVLRAHEGAASVINVAGRQRMLSQRIAGLAAQSALNLPVKDDLLHAIDQFETSHRDLIRGNPVLNLPAASSPELQAIYFNGPHPLDAAVSEFVRRARALASMEPGTPASVTLSQALFAEAREPILTSLDSVVSVHQQTSEAQLLDLERMQTGSLIVIITTLVVEAVLIFRPMVMKIARYTHTLIKIAATDPLTGALNRRSFNDRAIAELSRASRHGRPISLLMIDADHFKSVNDRFGHAGGDAVLQALVNSITGNLRPSDLLGRLGGEEFGILLAETGLAGAHVVAERIRKTIETLEVRAENSVITFTISTGVAEFDPSDPGLQRIMERADAALYQAKSQGRNRVVGADSPRPAPSAELQTGLAAA